MEHSNIAEKAEELIKQHGGVRAAARAIGINHGILSLARAGHDFPKARQALGLPPQAVPVQPCPDCGKVHTQHKQCPAVLQKARRRGRRHRLHYEAGHGDTGRARVDELRKEMQAAGCGSFTDYVDWLRHKDATR